MTKLMHIKQGKRGGGRHLYNSIRYVLNKKKTRDGLLVGGNVGTEPEDVHRVMMDTKADRDKTDGRQGYHFVLSFKPGETDEQTAYDVVREFCEEYLGDNYEYVFSIHNDHDHLHGHIVFNSVNRVDGYKYRYEKGDWEKYIQPITDKICIKHGLQPLQFENEKKVGRSYAEWKAEKGGKPSWKKIIRSDIDYAIGNAKSEEQFLQMMKSAGYTIRKGTSSIHGTYYTFCAPGQSRGWRSYNLGDGYSYATIQSRMQKEQYFYAYPQTPRIKGCSMKRQSVYRGISAFQKKRIRKIYFITYRRWDAKNPYAVDQQAVRKSLLHIDRLIEDVNYLLRSRIQSYEALCQRETEVLASEKELKNQKYSTTFLKEDEQYQEYIQLKKSLDHIPAWDDRFESVLDRLEVLEKELPEAMFQENKHIAEIEEQLQRIREEKRIIRHIKKEEQSGDLMVTQWNRSPTKAMEPDRDFIAKEVSEERKGDDSLWKKS